MPTIEEMTTWSADEVAQAVRGMLPAGWALSSSALKGRFWVRILKSPDEEGERPVAWEDFHVDQRILLFDAYGWLLSRGHQAPSPSSPPSKRDPLRRQKLARQAAARWAGVSHENIPGDPEDVDPKEVDAVYESFRKKQL